MSLEKNESEKQKKRELCLRILSAAVPILILIYEEVLLRWSTTGGPWDITLLFVVLFSAAYGIVFFFLTSFSRNGNINRGVRVAGAAVTAVVFTVFYFIYRTFKMFYDLRTVFSGGVDAAQGFTGVIYSMVFSASGLLHIAAFLLPVILYAVLARKFDSGKPHTGMERLVLLSLFTVFFVSGILAISYNRVLYGAYTSEYSYQTAVTDFGLLTGTRLDAQRLLTAREVPMTFETLEEDSTAPAEEETLLEAQSQRPVSYGYNRLKLDFDALAENASALEQQLDSYVESETASKQNAYTGLFKGKNLIFISAEAFSAEVIDEKRTPTLYRLATKGINFTDYYQPASAGTTGGEYENLFGALPSEGGSSFKITSKFHNLMTMGSQLGRLGYNGWAFHNNDYTFYDRNITHNNLGYSNGFMGIGNGMEEYVSTESFPESDLEMIDGTLGLYIDQEPFNVYYMSVSGHSLYNLGNAMSKKHWDEVKDLEGYTDAVKCYLAANLELEDAMTLLVDRLEEKGIADDTVIVIAADHFPYGLDYGEDIDASDNLASLYGYKVTNYLERDHNRLIIWSGSLEKTEPVIVDTPTSSLDILPTLLNLFGVEYDSRLLVGRDVFSTRSPLVFTLNYDWKTDKGTYYAGMGKFVPNEGVEVSDAYVENMRRTVRNKISYCKGLLQTDYMYHVLSAETGEEEE